MQTKIISTGYTPRTWQSRVHSSLKRFKVLVLHRRAGKTVMVINEITDRGLTLERHNPQYAYIAPTYGQAKRVAWDYFKEFTKNIPGVTVNESELRIDIPRPWKADRIRIYLLGAENPDSIRGVYLDGAVLDEYGTMVPAIWGEVIRPALSDRQGWAIFLGTPNGMNHFYSIYQHASAEQDKPNSSWMSFMLKASESGLLPESELEDAKATMSEDAYEQEYECSFQAALTGAYYGKELIRAEKEERICSVPYDRAVVVDTFWDLGVGDSTAIWFVQCVGKEIHLIDYLEDCGQGLDFYVRALKSRAYLYGTHYLPHDAAARELGTGKTRQEQLRTLGIGSMRILPKQNPEDGINAARMILNRCWWDKVKTARGLECLKNYQRKWDPKNQVFSTAALHNWASHGADAFRCLAMGLKEDKRSMIDLPRKSITEYDIYGRRKRR